MTTGTDINGQIQELQEMTAHLPSPLAPCALSVTHHLSGRRTFVLQHRHAQPRPSSHGAGAVRLVGSSLLGREAGWWPST